MFVVIVGDRDRNRPEDKDQVLGLLEQLKTQYTGLIVVSTSCESGIGNIVRSHCIDKSSGIAFIELALRLWVKLSKAKTAWVYTTRNSSLMEIGEVFHIFSPEGGLRAGTDLYDLYTRVRAQGRPMQVHQHDGTTVEFNMLKSRSTVSATEVLQSNDLKDSLEEE